MSANIRYHCEFPDISRGSDGHAGEHPAYIGKRPAGYSHDTDPRGQSGQDCDALTHGVKRAKLAPILVES